MVALSALCPALCCAGMHGCSAACMALSWGLCRPESRLCPVALIISPWCCSCQRLLLSRLSWRLPLSICAVQLLWRGLLVVCSCLTSNWLRLPYAVCACHTVSCGIQLSASLYRAHATSPKVLVGACPGSCRMEKSCWWIVGTQTRLCAALCQLMWLDVLNVTQHNRHAIFWIESTNAVSEATPHFARGSHQTLWLQVLVMISLCCIHISMTSVHLLAHQGGSCNHFTMRITDSVTAATATP